MEKQSIMTFLLSVLLAIAAGVATSLQPGINRMFGEASGSKVYGGVINFAVGLLAMTVVCLIVRPPLPEANRLIAAPWWAWTGGLLGAFFVTLAIFLIRPMGNANYLASMIAGQFIGSMIVDHFGLLGLTQHPFTWGRALGLLLIGGGVVCIRYL